MRWLLFFMMTFNLFSWLDKHYEVKETMYNSWNSARDYDKYISANGLLLGIVIYLSRSCSLFGFTGYLVQYIPQNCISAQQNICAKDSSVFSIIKINIAKRPVWPYVKKKNAYRNVRMHFLIFFFIDTFWSCIYTEQK